MHKYISYVFFFFSIVLNGQMNVKYYNTSNFTNTNIEITTELENLTPDEFKTHPEYGHLPYNTPCENCVELIHKRTENSRYFVTKGSEGTEFHSQTAYGALHYKDSNGDWISYDPRLFSIGNGEYIANNQLTPITFSLNNENTSIDLGTDKFVANNKLELFLVDSSNNETSLGRANWSIHTIGEDGIYIYNAWKGIDIEIVTERGKIKSNFIINKKPNNISGYKYLMLKDNIVLPFGYKIFKGEGHKNIDNKWEGTINVNGPLVSNIEIGRSIGYDNSTNSNSINFGYEFSNNYYKQFIPISWLEDTSLGYPLIIDPSVTSTATYTTGVMEFLWNGTYCGGASDCQYSLTANRPANSTLTNATTTIAYVTTAGSCGGGQTCRMRDAGFKIYGPCGISPSATLWWTCLSNATGTCGGTLGIWGLASCTSPLSACNGTLDFTMSNSYCTNCSTGGTVCGGAVPCHTMASGSWSVTLTGTTLETLGNTATGNGTYNYGGTCSGTQVLNPNASGGVPGYTYLWSPGGQTSSTITVNNWPNATYTCTVTDACGVTRTATFNINCPLSVELLSFAALYNGNNVELKWKTASEINNSHFDIERSIDGKAFKAIATINGNGTTNVINEYKYTDSEDLSGGYYYRLKQVDYDGQFEYSEVKYVYVSGSNDAMLVYPNPAENIVTLEFNSYQGKAKTVTFVNTLGQVLMEQQASVVDGQNKLEVDISALPKGNYFVLLKEDVILYKSRLVITR